MRLQHCSDCLGVPCAKFIQSDHHSIPHHRTQHARFPAGISPKSSTRMASLPPSSILLGVHLSISRSESTPAVKFLRHLDSGFKVELIRITPRLRRLVHRSQSLDKVCIGPITAFQRHVGDVFPVSTFQLHELDRVYVNLGSELSDVDEQGEEPPLS